MSSIWTIRRSASDAKLTGLCAGVAQHWGVDPVLVRVGCALLALSGGIGVVLYVAGWLLIPVEGKNTSPVDDFFGSTGRRWPKEVWITLIVIACLAVFAVSGSISPFGVGPAVVLAVIWYFGFYRNRRKQTGDPSAPPAVPPAAAPQFVRYPGPPTPFTEAAEAWQRRIEENARQSAAREAEPVAYTRPSEPATAYVWPSPPPASSRPSAQDPVRVETPDPAAAERVAYLATPDPVGLYSTPERVVAPATLVRRRDTLSAKRLRLVTLLAVGLALGGLAIADTLGVAVSLTAYLGVALAVVGLALIAATWLGRARGLLPVGLLLAVAVLATTSAPRINQLDDWAAPTVVRYSQVAELPAAGNQLDAGRLQVDLSQLTLTADTPYQAHVDVGQLDVIVPEGMNVVINYSVDVGVVRTFGHEVGAGTDLNDTVSEPNPVDKTKPTLTLDLSVDQGDLQVRR